MSELKACPVCSGEATTIDVNGDKMAYCNTEGCFIRKTLVGIDKWQFRPAETKIKAEGIMEAVNCLERPDVPLAPSLIMSDDLIEYANKLEKGE